MLVLSAVSANETDSGFPLNPDPTCLKSSDDVHLHSGWLDRLRPPGRLLGAVVGTPKVLGREGGADKGPKGAERHPPGHLLVTRPRLPFTIIPGNAQESWCRREESNPRPPDYKVVVRADPDLTSPLNSFSQPSFGRKVFPSRAAILRRVFAGVDAEMLARAKDLDVDESPGATAYSAPSWRASTCCGHIAPRACRSLGPRSSIRRLRACGRGTVLPGVDSRRCRNVGGRLARRGPAACSWHRDALDSVGVVPGRQRGYVRDHGPPIPATAPRREHAGIGAACGTRRESRQSLVAAGRVYRIPACQRFLAGL